MNAVTAQVLASRDYLFAASHQRADVLADVGTSPAGKPPGPGQPPSVMSKAAARAPLFDPVERGAVTSPERPVRTTSINPPKISATTVTRCHPILVIRVRISLRIRSECRSAEKIAPG